MGCGPIAKPVEYSGDFTARTIISRRAFRPLHRPCDDMRNMRSNGVRSLSVSCHLCGHRATISADRWRDDVPVPSLRSCMVCTGCGIVGGADVRPAWLERPERESLVGAQWR